MARYWGSSKMGTIKTRRKIKPRFLKYYWCTRCGLYYPRKDFEGEPDPRCPTHGIRLRKKPREGKFKRKYLEYLRREDEKKS